MIRKATILDVDSIYGIEKQVFTYDVYSRGVIESNILNPTYTTLVVEVDSSVVGFVTASTVLDESEVLKIAVSIEYQKQGLGGKLLNLIESMLVDGGTKTMFLEVRADNSSAISFYERYGYQKISSREKYYGDVDAYIYRKGLIK